MKITGSTRLLGLFGYPVKHTISPAMHNAGFRKLGLDLIYLPFSVHPSNLKAAVKSLAALGFLGINVTVPHKQNVIPYLDSISPEAESIGAVNTILVRENKLTGYNTDGIGFVLSLGKYSLKGKTMFLLGAGGAGHAVAVEAAKSSINRIFVADKEEKRVKELCKIIPDNRGVPVKGSIKDFVEAADIVVNATPVGLRQENPISIPAGFLFRRQFVYDLIYNPMETKLLTAAREKGCKTMNGLGMLLYQGARAFTIWTGRKAPVSVMQKALKKEVTKVREG